MPRKLLRLPAVLVLGMLSVQLAAADDVRLTLDFNGPLTMEVVYKEEDRARGLSNREQVPHGTGMVFALPGLRARADCFWMKDTLVPLDAAFVDGNGVIIHIATMVPHSQETHCPSMPSTWVLEAAANWFQRQGFFVGMYVGDENLAALRSIDTDEQQ